MSQLGSRIRDLREDAGISSMDLAKLCGLRHQYLLSIEEGTLRFVHPRTMDKIADALGVSYDDLVQEQEQAETDSVDEEVAEPYRLFVSLVLHGCLSLGVITVIAILSTIVAYLVFDRHIVEFPLTTRGETSSQFVLEPNSSDSRLRAPARTLDSDSREDPSGELPRVGVLLHGPV